MKLLLKNALSDYLKLKSMPKKEFAKRLRKSPTYVNHILNGEVPSPEVLKRISGILDVNYKFLADLAVKQKIEEYVKTMDVKYFGKKEGIK